MSDSSAGKLADLIALAHEPSSAKRRELLREVTDLFFVGAEGYSPSEMQAFDGVMSVLAAEMEQEIRAELAGRLADAPRAPQQLVRTLAADYVGVSEPILARSKALDEADLVSIAKARGQSHLRAISGRSDLTTSVSDVIVARADDATLGVLLVNSSAPLSRKASETVVDRAVENPALHEAVVDRHDLPVDLLHRRGAAAQADHGPKRRARSGGAGGGARGWTKADGRPRRRLAGGL
jgi:uncharacterized protein (DUF2336 family)